MARDVLCSLSSPPSQAVGGRCDQIRDADGHLVLLLEDRNGLMHIVNKSTKRVKATIRTTSTSDNDRPEMKNTNLSRTNPRSLGAQGRGELPTPKDLEERTFYFIIIIKWNFIDPVMYGLTYLWLYLVKCSGARPPLSWLVTFVSLMGNSAMSISQSANSLHINSPAMMPG